MLHIADETPRTAVVDATTLDERENAGHGYCRYVTSIANRPLLAHVIDQLVGVGIDEVLVVAPSELRHRLTGAVYDAKRPGTHVQFVEHAPGDASTGLIPRLRSALGDRPAILHSGDCLFPGDIQRLRESFRFEDVDAAVLVCTSSNHAAHGPSQRSLAAGYLHRARVHGSAMIVGRDGWSHLEERARESFSVPELAESLAESDCRVSLHEAGEHWCFCDSTERLLVANRMLLDALPFQSAPTSVGVDTSTEGRVLVSPSAKVSRSRLRGPVLIDEHAVVEDSFIGPYTAIGAGATVVGTELDYTMVLSGAEVRYPGHRIEASVIGERAVVKQSFALPAGMHLRIGPGAQVTLG